MFRRDIKFLTRQFDVYHENNYSSPDVQFQEAYKYHLRRVDVCTVQPDQKTTSATAQPLADGCAVLWDTAFERIA